MDADFLDTENFMKLGETARDSGDSVEILLGRLKKHILGWLANTDIDTVNGRRTEILKNCLDMGNSDVYKRQTQDVDLTAEDLKVLAGQFKDEYKAMIGEEFPTDPKEQLMGAIKAVFRSWDNPRANVYRRDNDIPYSWGTAVNVQMMAFGNMGDTSGTGVAFTRDPATGEKKLMGEFLMNAQGEDVVAGVRTPQKISQLHDCLLYTSRCV